MVISKQPEELEFGAAEIPILQVVWVYDRDEIEILNFPIYSEKK